MADNIDFSVNNYTIEELLDIFGIDGPVSQNEIIEHGSEMIEKYRKNKKSKYINFFSAATNKLLSNYQTVESFLAIGSGEENESDMESLDGKEGFISGPITQKQQEQQEQQEELREEQSPQPEQSKKPINKKYVINVGGKKEYILPAENMWKHNQYQTQTTRNKLNQYTMPQRRDNIKVPMALDHAVQLPKKLLMPNTYAQVPFAQGGMNPVLQNTYLTWVNVDSQFRTITSNTTSNTSYEQGNPPLTTSASGLPVPQITQADTSTDFIFTLEPPVTDVLSMSLGTLEVPLSGYYGFSKVLGNTTFDISFNWHAPGAYASTIPLNFLTDFWNPPAPIAFPVPATWLDYWPYCCKFYETYMALGNIGYFSPTKDISNSTVLDSSGGYICATVPDGNYQTNLATANIDLMTYLTIALMTVVGPVPLAEDGLYKSWITYLESGAAATLTTVTAYILGTFTGVTSSPYFIRAFKSQGTGKVKIVLNGTFDWWVNAMVPLCVPTSSYRRPSVTNIPNNTGILPWKQPPSTATGAFVIPPLFPPAVAEVTDESTRDIFGNFIYCWNEIVCNWAHTDISGSFAGTVGTVPPINVTVTPPSITFEEFLKQQPGYEDLQLNGGWGAWGFVPSGSLLTLGAALTIIQQPTVIAGPWGPIPVGPPLTDSWCPGTGPPGPPTGAGTGMMLEMSGTHVPPAVTSCTITVRGTGYQVGDLIYIPSSATPVIGLWQDPGPSLILRLTGSAFDGGTSDVSGANPFDARTLQGYWHNKQGHLPHWLPEPPLAHWYPPSNDDIAAGPLPLVPETARWYPGTAWGSGPPYKVDVSVPPVDECSGSWPPTPIPPTIEPFYAMWRPDMPVGGCENYVPPGQPPPLQTAQLCCPPFAMNQVQIYVLYYIQLVLIPEAIKKYSQVWTDYHTPLVFSIDTAKWIQNSTKWLWLGGVLNFPPSDIGEIVAGPIQVGTNNHGWAVLPWPFPFTFNWSKFRFNGFDEPSPGPYDPLITYSAAHALVPVAAPEQAVSPGFLPELPDFDIRWYDPDDPNKGNCFPYQCTTGTGQQTSKASFPGRKLNANLGWSLGFKEAKTFPTVNNLLSEIEETSGTTSFLTYAALNAGIWIVDASGNGAITGAPPWHYILLTRCLSSKKSVIINNMRAATFKVFALSYAFSPLSAKPAPAQLWPIYLLSEPSQKPLTVSTWNWPMCLSMIFGTSTWVRFCFPPGCPYFPTIGCECDDTSRWRIPGSIDAPPSCNPPGARCPLIPNPNPFPATPPFSSFDSLWLPYLDLFINGFPVHCAALLCRPPEALPYCSKCAIITPPASISQSQLVPLPFGEGDILLKQYANIQSGDVCIALWYGMTSLCIVHLNGTNYLTLVVDDFQRNRYNGNMPGLPQPSSQEDFKLPPYYQRYKNSMPICVDASGNLTYQEGKYGPKTIARNCRLGTNNPNDIIDGSNNLTNAQKYTALQILNHQKQQYLDQNTAPLVSNVLVRAPIDRLEEGLGGMVVINPRYSTASGGRGIGRRYYGPTTLKRLRIQLLDDLGNPMDLNCGNISFSLLLERLYQY